MWFTTAELAEIRSAFRQRIKAEPPRKQPVRRKPKPEPLPELVREPGYDDADILTTLCLADVFGVTARTVRRWADASVLPSFRTLGGQRRFRWAEV
jgi:excisionase family DNA binding protein